MILDIFITRIRPLLIECVQIFNYLLKYLFVGSNHCLHNITEHEQYIFKLFLGGYAKGKKPILKKLRELF